MLSFLLLEPFQLSPDIGVLPKALAETVLGYKCQTLALGPVLTPSSLLDSQVALGPYAKGWPGSDPQEVSSWHTALGGGGEWNLLHGGAVMEWPLAAWWGRSGRDEWQGPTHFWNVYSEKNPDKGLRKPSHGDKAPFWLGEIFPWALLPLLPSLPWKQQSRGGIQTPALHQRRPGAAEQEPHKWALSTTFSCLIAKTNRVKTKADEMNVYDIFALTQYIQTLTSAS